MSCIPNAVRVPGLTVVDYMTNTFRLALMSDIIDEPTKKQTLERDLAIGRKKVKKS